MVRGGKKARRCRDLIHVPSSPREGSDFSAEGEVLFLSGSEAELSRCVWVGAGPW